MDTAHARAAAVLVLAFLLSAAPAIAWDEPSSFEGIPWGASPWDATAITTARGDSLRCYRFSFCWGGVDIGPIHAEAWYGFTDAKLRHVHLRFDPKDYAQLKQAFIDRYGSPTFKGVHLTLWRGQTIAIRLFETPSAGAFAILGLYKSMDRDTNSPPPLPMRRMMSP